MTQETIERSMFHLFSLNIQDYCNRLSSRITDTKHFDYEITLSLLITFQLVQGHKAPKTNRPRQGPVDSPYSALAI